MPEQKPVAFLSYVHTDDKYKQISEFCQRLSDEVHVQTGEEFLIFQDRNNIQWGQNWKKRIEESLDAVTFLIPVITPSFFNSPQCRDELQKFLKREDKLNRNDLILPVYYVGCQLLEDEEERKTDKLAQIIAERQRADWRELRFESHTSPQVCRMLANLGVQIRDALGRTAAPSSTSTTTQRTGGESSNLALRDAESVAESIKTVGRPSTKTEPPIHIVDQMHRGDYTTISEAIEAANPGDRILVRPGLYQEGLVIEKPLEIIGYGSIDEVVVQAEGKSVVVFSTTMGRIANMTLRQMGGEGLFCVNIAQGRLELDDCDITSRSLACVGIYGGADPRLRRNRIHDGKQGGVYVNENGLGTLEDNDIFGNALSGVEIKEGGNPTLRRNRIHDGKQGGVFVNENGLGTLEDNDIFGNAFSGVEIRKGGNPTLRRNRIHDGKQSGVYVYDNGQGTLEDNDIFGNRLSGVSIAEGGNPMLCQNRINKNGFVGVYVHSNGSGTIEDNDLSDNAKGAWEVSVDSEQNVKRARNKE